MASLFIAVLSASLLGSLHCAGMCGPFCGIAVSGGRSSRETTLLHSAYHGGRLVTYCLLGAIAGSVGALLDLASTLAGLQPIALAAAGGLMVLIGVTEIARLQGWRWGQFTRHASVPTSWVQIVQTCQRFVTRQSALPRALGIGLLTTLLPCGWLYAFVLTAAGSGDPLLGAGVMAAFWLGTLPVLLSLGIGIRRLAGVLGEKLPLITATALVAVGFVTLSTRMSLSAEQLAEVVTNEAQTNLAATPDPEATPPCCRARAEAP